MSERGLSRSRGDARGRHGEDLRGGRGLYLQPAYKNINLLNRGLAARRKACESRRLILKTRNDLQQVRNREHCLHSSRGMQQLDFALLPLQRNIARDDDADASAIDL